MMTAPMNHRKPRLFLALLIAIVAAACSQPASTPRNTADLLASPPPTNASAMSDHASMGMADTNQPMDPNAPMAQATAEVAGVFGSGKPVTVTLHVTDMMSGKPMDADAFDVVHTERIHVLDLDPSLTDYSHSHPTPTGTPGEWVFAFTPKFNRPYHLWLDVTPRGGKQAYVMVTVNGTGAMAPAEKTLSLAATVDDFSASLSFDTPLVVGQAVMGHLIIRRAGKPFAALEPVMGAYSHIVGVSEDWTTIAHMHPMGTEPTQASDRGGPAIDFHMEPQRPGFLKLFAQIRVNGRDVFLPFGTNVAEPEAKAATP